VDYGVWTFERGADRLEITRKDLDDGTALIVAGDGTPRSYFFREYDRLETFQKDMETLLLKTGRSFVSYEPDRRAGGDRRDFPRRSNDRRRWWTDGTPKQRQPGAPSAHGARSERDGARRATEKLSEK
jgi:hypothetical protein